MQKGNHIGKVVVTMPTKEGRETLLNGGGSENRNMMSNNNRIRRKEKLCLSKDGSYILFGGLGGVGQALAVFFAEAGAGERTSLLPFLSYNRDDLLMITSSQSSSCLAQHMTLRSTPPSLTS